MMRGVYLELLQHDVKHNGLVEIAPHTLADLRFAKKIEFAELCKLHFANGIICDLQVPVACSMQCTVLFAEDDTEIRK